MTEPIKKSTFDFQRELSDNNHRDWFAANKHRYIKAHENVLAFVEALLAEMRKHDLIQTRSAKESLFRIYRDVRFSKDKSPYKTYWSGHFKRATMQLRGGYYFQIGPSQTIAAGGFFSPNPEDLRLIRKDVSYNHGEWQSMLRDKRIVKTFGAIQGEKVLTAPKGFSKENPAIDLIRHKQFYFERRFTDKEALDAKFSNELDKSFRNLRGYFDYMSEVLTSDADGVIIV